mgnify:FL=1|tara:strand:+ start:1484 stop:2293 length:810 start_codon:yes stop_codon:yes gene_type:complete
MAQFPEQPLLNNTNTSTSPKFISAKKQGNTAQIVPILFYDVYQDIALALPEQPNISIVKAEVNIVIRRINDEIGLWNQLVQVSPSTISTSIDLMVTTAIESETTDEIEDYGRFRFEYDYVSTESRLRLEDNVVEVQEVYLDDVEWEQVPYQKLKDTNNVTEKYWSQIGRFIYFPKDLSTTTEILKIKVKKSFSFLDNVVGKDAIIDLPESYRQLLISGVLYSLTARPKFKDPDIFAVNKEIFDMELFSLKNQYANLEPTYMSRDMTYKY